MTSNRPSETHSQVSPNPVLRNWQAAPPRDRRLGLKVLVTLSLLAVVALFSYALRKPFAGPELQVLILGPGSPERITLENVLSADLAHLLARANADLVSNSVEQLQAPIAVTIETDRTLKRTENEIETALANQVHSDATLMVYVSGVLAVDRSRPCLCETAREATSLGNTFDILTLVESLQALPCKHVMLSVDAVMPSVDVQGQVAASQAWECLSDEIEERLVQTDGTPIVIQLSLSWIDKDKFSATTSKLARTFSSVFQEDFLKEKRSLFDIQSQLEQAANGTQEHNAVAGAAQTLISSNWPLDSRTYVYRRLKSKHSAAANVASAELEIKQRKEALDKCAIVFAQWQASSEADTPTSLRFPKAVSWREKNRYAYHCLHDAYQVLCSWDSLGPDELDNSVVLNFVECMRCVDEHEALPEGSPSWLQSLPGTLTATVTKSSSSLVTNALFKKLGMLKRQDDDKNDRYLRELLELVSSSSASSARAVTEWIKHLPEQVDDCVEARWCAEVLEQPDINWETQRLFIQAKLLSMRVASDPLAADACSQLLAFADKDRVCAERALQDRDQQDWLTRCTRSIRQAIGGYEQAIIELERYRSLQSDYDQKFAVTTSTDEVQILDLAERRTNLRDYCQRWAEALSPWNNDLAMRWAAKSQTYGSLAATECSIESQIKSSVEYDHFTHSELEQLHYWLPSHAANIPKSSSFWVFAKQNWKTKHDELSRIVQSSKEHLSQTTQLNVERLESERYGATSDENAELDEQLRWWLALSSGPRMPFEASQATALEIESDAELDLIAQGEVQTRVAIRSSRSEVAPIQLQAMFDESAIEVAIAGQSLEVGEAVAVVPQTAARTKASQLTESISVPIVVRRRNQEASKQPIVLVATRGGEQRRALIRLNAPHEPMVECEISNKRLIQPSAISDHVVLVPNQINPLTVSIRNLQRTGASYSLKVYSLPGEGVTPPAGSIAVDDAQLWLSSIGLPAAVASCESIQLASGQCKEAPLVQLPLAVDQPLSAVRTLLVAIVSESQKQMQFATWTPRALHPIQYVRPTVSYDADRQTVAIRYVASMPAAIPADGTLVEIELLSMDQLQSIAHMQSRLYPGRMESAVTLSTASCKANRALLAIAIDGWRSSFCYEIDLRNSGTIEVSKNFAALRLQATSPTNVVALDSTEVEFQVDAVLNDALFDPSRDVIKVGFDLNSNRSLADDATMQLKGTRSVKFALTGITKAGEICVQPEIRSYRVKLPATVEWNQRLNAMAELHSQAHVASSNSIPVVFDRRPPQVNSIRLMGSIPSLLGTPIIAEVQVSDGELSGVSSVEGAWSLSGEVEIEASMKAVPAVYREGDRWLLTMPTDVLPSGKSLLLVRARDQAGNVGNSYPVVAELLTQAELTARAASFTTSVRGDVFYSKMPLEKINLRLVAKLEAKEDAKAQEPQIVASASTDEQGRFQLSDVHSGSYELELSGIVRGTRVKQVRSITVDAQSITPEIHFRLDQKQ